MAVLNSRAKYSLNWVWLGCWREKCFRGTQLYFNVELAQQRPLSARPQLQLVFFYFQQNLIFSRNFPFWANFQWVLAQAQWSTRRKWRSKNSLKWFSLKWVHGHFSYETVPVPAEIFTKVDFSLNCDSLKWVPYCSRNSSYVVFMVSNDY